LIFYKKIDCICDKIVNVGDTISKKNVIDYWDKQPCNIKHSRKEFGTREYFDEVEKRKYFVEPHIPKFANFNLYNGKKVLEIGCGIGTDAVNFARSGAIYTGVEISQKSLDIAKKRFEVYGLDGNFLQGDAESISSYFPNQYFDLIYSFGVLHHTPSIDLAIRSIRNLMNSNSIFKFMVYSKNSYKQALINEGLDQPEAQKGCPIANSYTKMEIIDILRKSNLKCSSIEKDHIFPYKINEYKKHKYVKEDWFEKMPYDIFRTLENNFGWHLLITSKI
jgi:ubiquinone/menaquinone biosynthesis C-methylase UbiE